ncbi:DUF4405 domain-containing protein [Candidatus Latescibacterota bacterium]
MEKRSFSWRKFTSFNLMISFIVISVTGIVLYIVPPGRVAFWINWTMLGLTKEDWAAVHTIFSFLFIVFSALHIFFNWKTLLSYLRDKISKSLGLKKEFSFAAVLTLAVFAGTLFGIPPFSSTMDFGESLKNSWEEGAAVAPAPHTELQTLEQVTEEFGMQIDRVIGKLGRNGIKVADPTRTLKQIAEENGIAPSDVYAVVQKRGDGGH